MMSTERTFLDISTVRIHGYLERTPKLSLIRGASALLAEATDPSTVKDALAERFPQGCVQICEEAGESESIIHLELSCQCGTCNAHDVARWGVNHMRSRVPAADFRSSWGTASTYSGFAGAADDGTTTGWGRSESPAPDVELAMLTPCDTCRRGYAGPRIGTARRCVDCARRHDAANRRSAHSVEEKLRRRLELRGQRTLDDFLDLARLGPEERRDGDRSTQVRKTNHLATVYIDGNGFRAMFSGAGRHAQSHGFDVNALSRGIGEAVWSALEAAARAVLQLHSGPDGLATDELPLIPHIVAADDLCVSLPAGYGWCFLTTYCSAFGRHAREVVQEAGRKWEPSNGRQADEVFEKVPPATASGSIVIAHASEPFSTCLDAAERLLKQAKRAVVGKEPSAMWVDVSREGFTPPAHRRPLKLQQLNTALLDELATLPQSLRRNLVSDVVDDPVDTRARVQSRARRLGLLDRSRFPAIADELRGRNADVVRFVDMVSLADWWKS